tara:strand:+ start:2712 stop:3080 length:369 start_codon:yes stop_codon:yes gene_type:complete
MASMSKHLLSGCTNGKAIKLTDTASSVNTDAGYLIHTAVSGTSNLDEVWLWAMNTDSVDRKLTIEFGGVASPDDLIEVTISAEAGLVQVCPGLLLQNGLHIKAFAAAANVITIHGFVNRITA